MKSYLTRVDPARGMARFYVVAVVPSLFGEWSVIKEWGRIGQGGTVRDSAFPSSAEAKCAAEDIVRGKVRRGYVQLSGWTESRRDAEGS